MCLIHGYLQSELLGAGHAYLFPRVTTRKVPRKMLLLGYRYDAAQAFEPQARC